MDEFKTRRWLQLALVNFCIVALAGVTLRYKINFPLPLINQKYLLYAHSHFAFVGWVSTALMALLVNYLERNEIYTNYKKYNRIIIVNCINAYGLFLSFLFQGYRILSISFSTLSIFISFYFIYHFWKDLKLVLDKSYAVNWFKMALILWGTSAIGAFTLAYLMATHNTNQEYYFAAIYFFLHFQYNGWFLFVCFGLLFYHLYRSGLVQEVAINKKLFFIMATTVAPSFLLSILWLKLPAYLRYIADISGILQLLVLLYFLKLIPAIKKFIPHSFTKTTRTLWILATIAFIIKVILQMLSIIPYFSHFAFAFRPIVIGYLHLSFLCIISFFIIGYINEYLCTRHRHVSVIGVILFIIGVLVQEVILMVQGLEVFQMEPIPLANILLFYCAILIAAGIIRITYKMNKTDK
ncbi:MAG: hypothetical protein JSS67_03980 [Bacteroidetes bacterium]|nr:hypothetical protein [Bacteroidota bacterium]